MTQQDQKEHNSLQKFIEICKPFTQNNRTEGENWHTKLREDAWNKFLLADLPTTQDENWKYTNLSPLFSQPFLPAQTTALPTHSDLKTTDLENTDINIVLINGYFSSSLSNVASAPQGLIVKQFSQISEEEYAKHLAFFNQSSTFFEILNQALAVDGLWIHVNKQVKIEQSIHICHISAGESHPTIVSPRVILTAEPFAEAQIFMSFLSLNDELMSLTNVLTEIFLDRNAQIALFMNQNEGQQRYHMNTLKVLQNQNSSFNFFSSVIGARLTRNELTNTLKESGASVSLKGLYLVQGQQHVDNHTEINHIAEHCTSNQLYKGILNDKGRAVFNGKVYVHPEAQQTNSYQLNKNLLMGEHCRVDTKPQLEIFADDVKCSHGATVGQLDKSEIFYLQTRGIPQKQAIRMLARGFVEDVVNQIQDDSTQKKLSTAIDPVLSSMTYTGK